MVAIISRDSPDLKKADVKGFSHPEAVVNSAERSGLGMVQGHSDRDELPQTLVHSPIQGYRVCQI